MSCFSFFAFTSIGGLTRTKGPSKDFPYSTIGVTLLVDDRNKQRACPAYAGTGDPLSSLLWRYTSRLIIQRTDLHDSVNNFRICNYLCAGFHGYIGSHRLAVTFSDGKGPTVTAVDHISTRLSHASSLLLLTNIDNPVTSKIAFPITTPPFHKHGARVAWVYTIKALQIA